MITPEWLTNELYTLEIHKDLQESIIRDIVRRILKTDFAVTDTAAWQAEKLQQSGMVFDDIVKEIAKRTKKSEAEIRNAFADAETEIFNYGDDNIEKAGYDVKAFKNISPAMKDIINAAIKKTTTEAKNLTKTTAVTSQTSYIKACDLAHMQITSGAFSYQEAIKNAIISAAKDGFKVIYPTGYISNLDVAIRRSALTGVNQTCGKLQEMRADEFGNDLMEISAHFGARPDHAEWQGQIVSRSGRHGYLSLDDIGYGTVAGFMGANCRHNWYIFFEGLSKRNYTREQLDEFKNASVTYNGETMPVYTALQKQRSMERGIKQSKQTLVAFDEAMKNVTTAEEKALWKQEFENEAVKLKSKETKIKDFCKQTGLHRDRYREQVFATATENGIKNFGKSVGQKAVKQAQNHYDVWRKSIGADDTPKTLAKYYEMKYNDKKTYNLLQGYAKAIDKGDISPLVGFDLYKQTAKDIEKHLIGIKTSDGYTVKSYSTHFVDRVIGQTDTPHKSMREGVPIENVKNALLNASKISKPYTKMHKGKPDLRITYKGSRCYVSYSITDNRLVHTNPN